MTVTSAATVAPMSDRRRRPSPRPVRSLAISLVGLIPLVVGLSIWQVAGSTRSPSFPTPSTWWAAGHQMWQSGEFGPALAATLTTFGMSVVLTLVVGTVAGVAIGTSPVLARGLSPLLDFFRTLPPPVIVPVAGLLFGITFRAGVIIVVISVIWPILLNTVAAVRTIPTVRLDMARSTDLGMRRRFLKVVLPSVIPGVAVGLRITLSMALVVTLLVDLLGSANGLGRLLLQKQQTFEAASVWAILLLIGLMGYLLNAVVGSIEKLLLRHWPPAV